MPNGNTKQTPVVPNDRCPRLIVLLNEVPPIFDPIGAYGRTNLVGKIEGTLEIISARLDNGLEELWSNGEWMDCWDTKKWNGNDPDEQWARAVSGMLVGTTYNGPAPSTGATKSTGYTISHKQFWDRFCGEYVFNWNNVPGNNQRILKQILVDVYNIDWAKNAKTEKVDDGKVIKVSTNEKSLSLKLNDEKTEVKLEIDNDRTIKLIAKEEMKNLNIYCNNNDDPIVPITFACVHLSTVGVLSRGIKNNELIKAGDTGISFNMNGTDAFSQKNGGNWHNNDKKKSGRGIKIADDLTPGSIYGWSTNGPSHVVFVLRVDKELKKVQFLDTGGINITGRDAGVVAMQGGNFDDPLADTIPGPIGSDTNDNYQGYGIPRSSLPDVLSLRKTRPFGLARLVLSSPVDKRDENPKDIHFVSRLLRMYSDNPDKNFPTSLMYWSLRDLPYEKDLQAWWVLYSPQYDLAKLMFKMNARNQKVRDLYQNVGGITTTHLKKLVIISSIGGGKVMCRQRWKSEVVPDERDPDKKKTVDKIVGFIDKSVIETKADPSNTNPLTSFNPTNAKIPLLLNDGYESLGPEKIDAALLNFNHNEFPLNNAGLNGTSPAIEIFNLNSQTQKPIESIAIILDDLDAQDFEAEGSNDNQYNHWVIWNIPIPSNNKIPENVPKLKTVDQPIKAVQGVNTGKTIGYIGPNPPEGTTHRYIFRVFGLDQMLTLSPGSNKSALIKAMDTHILQTGEYVATYTSRLKTK